MALAKKAMAKEMPNELARVKIRPKNWLEQRLDSDAIASHNPIFSEISYNPEYLLEAGGYGSGDTVIDILAHELTHVRQTKEQPMIDRFLSNFFENYYTRPDEMEAFQTMRDRQFKQHRRPSPLAHPSSPNKLDIFLPPESKK